MKKSITSILPAGKKPFQKEGLKYQGEGMSKMFDSLHKRFAFFIGSGSQVLVYKDMDLAGFKRNWKGFGITGFFKSFSRRLEESGLFRLLSIVYTQPETRGLEKSY